MVEQAKTRKPNPKRFATVLVAVALFGGPCALQDVMTEPAAPSREQLSSTLEKVNPVFKQLPPDKRDTLLDASASFAGRQLDVQKRFASYRRGFGVLLVIGYFVLFTFALRAAQYGPNAARPLSVAALVMMPLRVASAAVDLATARAMQQPVEQFGVALTALSSQRELPEAQLQSLGVAMGGMFGWAQVALQAGWALALLILFSQAWRYFGRPDVQAIYQVDDDDEP